MSLIESTFSTAIDAVNLASKYGVALERIANFKDCMGPGCPWCDNKEWEDSSGNEHPFTAEAKIAREALGLEER